MAHSFFIPSLYTYLPLISIGTSSEPHRNLIGTSSEPHRNFTESLPYNNRHFAIPSHQSLHTSRSIPSFYSLLITVFGSVLAATVPRDLGYLEHLERLFFHFFFFFYVFFLVDSKKNTTFAPKSALEGSVSHNIGWI